MTLEYANHLQAAAGKKTFSQMTQAELTAELAELNATLDTMEESGAAASPHSGFKTMAGMARVILSLLA